MEDENTITIKKDSLWKYSTIILLAVLVIGGFFLLRGSSGSGSGAVVTDTSGGNQPSVNANSLIEDNDPVLGDANAGISIRELAFTEG